MAKASKSKHSVTVHSAEGLSARDDRPRAVIYSRVSTAGQDATHAVADLKRAAEQRGYRVALEVVETGSGARNDREGLQRVLDAARRGEVSACFVTKLDRFGRSTIDLLSNIRTLTSYGCRFACTEQALDVRTDGDPIGALTLQILAAVAEFERTIIVSRVREGQRRAMKRGVQFGRKLSPGPSPDEVRRMREAKRSWSQIAEHYECTVGLARRRFAEA